ncbi:Gustatory receptor 104e [Halyomorpha halys]|nr:Gustatory receptor 104e [Halyomorpha halys]
MGTQLSSIFKFPRIAGLFPFDDEFQWSRKWFIYSILIQLLSLPSMIISFFHHYHNAVTIRNRTLNVLIVMSCIQNLLSFFYNVFTVIQLTENRNSVFHLLAKLNKEIVECRTFPKIRFYTTYINFVWYVFLLIIWLSLTYDGFGLENLNLTLMILLLSTSSICISGQLWDLMRVLSNLVRETTKGDDEGSIRAMDRISAYGESLNEIYSPLLLIMVVLSFIQMVCQSYLVLAPIFLNQSRILLIFIIINFFRLGTIIYSCISFLDEIQWFNDKLHWKILNDKTGRYSNNEMFFFHFIAYKKTKFSACGFFDIDYTLIGTMISVCTTYLVIVLQYGQGSQS